MSQQSSDVNNRPAPEAKARRPHKVSASEIGVIIGLVALVALVAFQVTRSREQERLQPARDEPLRGVVCPRLSAAFQAHQSFDDAALESAVRSAARQAEAALDNSGQEFGAPERAALELSFILEEEGYSRAEVERWLERGLQACRQLGPESPAES